MVVGWQAFGSKRLGSTRFNPCLAPASAASQSRTQHFTLRVEIRHRPVSTAQSMDFTPAYPEIRQSAIT
jgi:hypothetical protein